MGLSANGSQQAKCMGLRRRDTHESSRCIYEIWNNELSTKEVIGELHDDDFGEDGMDNFSRSFEKWDRLEPGMSFTKFL